MTYSDLIFKPDPSLKIIVGSYDWALVCLSVLIAIATSTTALQLVRFAQSQNTVISKNSSILAGAIALGAGIWSMHFIGMMALNLCTKVDYHFWITTISMCPSILASWYALKLISSNQLTNTRLAFGGVLVGAGIGTMHYFGMLAMQMTPKLQFDLRWVATSVVVAVVLATLSLWIGLKSSRYEGVKATRSLLIGGSVMGIAISGMHYTGMHASVFIGITQPSFDPSINHSASFALGITLVTTLVAIVAVSINALIRYRKMLVEIKASEMRLTTILNTTKDSIITVNREGLIQSFNDATTSIFGLECIELVNHNISRLLHFSNIDFSLTQFAQRKEQKNQVSELDNVLGIKKDGTHFPVKVTLGSVEIKGEQVIIAYITDLTQKKAFEDAVREKDIQLHSLMNNIPGVAFRFRQDAFNTPVLLSPSIKTITGWEATDYIKNIVDIREHIFPDEREKLNQAISEAEFHGGSYTIEYRILNKHGEERWISETGSLVNPLDQSAKVIDGVMMDITETKRKNAAFESIVNAIQRSTCIVEYTTEGIITDANQQFLEAMGFTREEVIGQQHAIFCPPDVVNSAQYQKKWSDLKQGKYVEGDYLRYGKNGKHVWIHATYNPLIDADGNVVKVLLFMLDITPRIEMEKALTEAKEKAEMAADAKATFLANMSHEIRTPMNAVIGFSEILMDTPLNTEQQKFLTTIRSSAKSLLHLLNDILDSAKLEKGKLEFEQLNFSLDNLLDSVVSTLWVQARKKNIDLELSIDNEVSGYYQGAEDRIRQVLMNIMGNAVKFTEVGKVKLTAMKGEADSVRFEIQDTGIGIPPDRLAVIFDPFTQADASMSRRFGGTGLGTTISKQLVEGMGGSINASSEIGVGSCFVVTLPLTKGTAPNSSELPLSHPIQALNILIADDISQNRELLSLLLKREGHTVEMAENGLIVLDKYQRSEYDLAILDVQMPEMDGLTAAKEIRKIELETGVERLPLIALTASVLEEDRLAVKEADMDGFASKPIDMEALNREIKRVIEQTDMAKTPETKVVSKVSPLVVDTDSGEKRWGDFAMYYHELQSWANKQKALLLDLTNHQQSLDYAAIQLLAHSCKGVAANLSAIELQQLYGLLETQARQSNLDAMTHTIVKIHLASDAFVAHVNRLQTMDNNLYFAQEGLMSNDEIIATIHQLKTNAQQGIIDDASIANLINGTASIHKSIAKNIELAFNDFEFQSCEKLLDELQISVLQ